MFAKHLFQKAINHHNHHQQQNLLLGDLSAEDLDVRIITHYGIPSTSSILSFDPIQSLLAVGTLDGRIKVIGGDNIEGLLISPKQQPYKYLEFLQNQGYLISITNGNEIQVWSMRSRCICSILQWECNVTAFSILSGSSFMYIGDEHGAISVLKFDAEREELLQLPYYLSSRSLAESAGLAISNPQPIVGVLPQPCSPGSRVLFACENGLIVLWDLIEARIITLKGDRILQLNNEVDFSSDTEISREDNMLQHHLEEKEISALCWASSDGSVLAVGYVDGDILLWKISVSSTKKSQQSESSNNIVNLQLSSAEKRLPIILLHWWANDKSRHDGDGQLLIYGGDEIGACEAVTILTLEWASGKQNLKCLSREVLKLSGSFADAVLLPNSEKMGSYCDPVLCVLTSPGKLQLFDNSLTSTSVPQKEKNFIVSMIEYPVVVPTMCPSMTVARLFSLPADDSLSKSLSKILGVKKLYQSSYLTDNVKKRTIAGGVLNHLSLSKDRKVERLYVTGYQDGSVWLWDATYPVLSLMCVVDSEQIKGLEIGGSNAPVSEVDICLKTLRLAVGVESGLVYLYSLNEGEKTNFHFIRRNTDEVHSLPQVKGPTYEAIFSILNSRIQVLQFSNSGAKLIVGYECARIAVLDTKSLKIVFLTDNLSGCSSPLVTVVRKEFLHRLDNDLNYTGNRTPDKPIEDYIFILTEDTRVQIISGNSGNVIRTKPLQLRKKSAAISMYIIDGSSRSIRIQNENMEKQSSNEDVVHNKSLQSETASQSRKSEAEDGSSENLSSEGEKYSYLLLCCKNDVHVFTMKSVLQGDSKSISKIKFARPCCWTTMFMKDEKTYGLLLLFQTGEIEIRSLPHLKLVKDTSLMSTLRWNFKAGMDKTISSTRNGHIALVLGSEVAFISVLARENNDRIPQSLPSLHDEVLAATGKSGFNFSSNHKKKQGIGSGFIGGMVKGLKAGKLKNSLECSSFSHLEGIFSKNPFQDAAPISTSHLRKDTELNIDDIEIDEPVPHTSSHPAQNNEQGIKSSEIKSEREKLLEGGSDAKPRVRTREEIIATYRKTGDASSVAGQARDKLLERQEKLERIRNRTEELQNEAEDFASLANELVKAMESRKWWQM